MAEYSGFNSKVVMGSTTVGSVSWKASERANKSPVTNTLDAGQDRFISGTKMVSFTIEGVVGATGFTVSTIPTSNAAGPEVKLYLASTDTNPKYDLTVTYIDEVAYDVDINGNVKVTITGSSNGAYTVA